MKRQIASLLLVGIFCTKLLASGGSIAGRVTMNDSENGEAIVGAVVLLQGTVRGTTTNSLGQFRLTDIPPGRYTLIFSMVGYQRHTRSDVTVTEGEETFLKVTLAQRPVQTEQVIVTASKREQSLEEVPVSISVMDAAELQRRNSLTIDDALRYVPGVNMTGPQINVRGSSGYSLGAGSRVLMLLDGVPFIAGDTGELIFESIPVGQVDRIEVLKGASSALYGSNALGGVINVITKPIPDNPETGIRAYGGFYNTPSFNQWRWSGKTRCMNGQSISLARRGGDFGVSLFFSRQLDDGYRENDYRRRYNFSLKTREDFSASSALTLNFGMLYQYSGQFLYWRNLDSALIPPLRHESDNLKSTRYYVSGLYSKVISHELIFTGKAMWCHNDWGFQSTGDIGRTESLTDGFRAEAASTLILGNLHTLTFGLAGNVDMIGGDMFGHRTIGGLALYGQDETKISGDLTLTVGARCDFQSVGLVDEGVEVNPKFALAYNPVEGTNFRASFGRGFRVPSVTEAFIAAGSSPVMGVPNRDLKPERSYSYEIGFAQALGDFGALDLAGFRSDFDNLIEPGLFVSGQNLEVQWRNVTKARVQGFESSLKLGFFGGDLVSNLGYTYVFPEDRTQNDLLKYRPRHLFYANALARSGLLSAGIEFRYISRVERIDDELVETGIVPDGDQRVEIVVADARLGADVSVAGCSLTVTLNIRNAFQRNYVELIGNLMPPRTYVLVIDARL